MKRPRQLLGFFFMMFCVGCATYTVPQQVYSGYLGTQAPVENLSVENIRKWKAASRQALFPKRKIILLHQGFDQLPNVTNPSLILPQAEFMRGIRGELSRHEFFSSVEIVSQTQWDLKTIEDVRKVAVLHDASYVLLMNGHYDLQTFYSSIGHYVGWVPYINFMVPLYKLEGSARIDYSILDVRSGAFLHAETTIVTRKRRGSGLFVLEHYRALARELLKGVWSDMNTTFKGWVSGV